MCHVRLKMLKSVMLFKKKKIRQIYKCTCNELVKYEFPVLAERRKCFKNKLQKVLKVWLNADVVRTGSVYQFLDGRVKCQMSVPCIAQPVNRKAFSKVRLISKQAVCTCIHMALTQIRQTSILGINLYGIPFSLQRGISQTSNL